jgi:hypothetical protein
MMCLSDTNDTTILIAWERGGDGPGGNRDAWSERGIPRTRSLVVAGSDAGG